MFGQGQIIQDLVYNTAVLSAAGTLLGAVIVFILLYMVLERKKTPLIAVFLFMMAAFSGMYWYMGHKAPNPLDIPKTVQTEAIKHYPLPPQVQPAPLPVPTPKARPRIKKRRSP